MFGAGAQPVAVGFGGQQPAQPAFGAAPGAFGVMPLGGVARTPTAIPTAFGMQRATVGMAAGNMADVQRRYRVYKPCRTVACSIK